MLAVGLVGAYGGSFAQLRALRFNRESPFDPYDVFPGGSPYDQVDELVLAEGGHTRELTDRLTVAARGYANAYRFSDTSPPSDPTTTAALDTTGSANTVGGELRGRYEVVVPERLGVTAGAEVSSNRTRSTAFFRDNPDALIADNPLNFALAGVYTEVDAQPVRWLGMTAGVRYDFHSELRDRVSPRAAVFLANPERYGLKLLYAEGFRNPSAFEAFFDDGADFVANPAAGPETIQSFELVAWAKPVPGLSTRVSAFSWDAADMLEARPSINPDDMGRLQFQNVTRYVSRGVEAELSYRNSRGWSGFAGGALARIGTEDAGAVEYGEVPNAPAITAGAGASTPRLWGRVHLSAETILIGPRATRPTEMGPSPDAPAWLGVNLTAFAPNLNGFDLTAGVRNLIGTRDLMPAPPDYDRAALETRTVARVPGEGREIFVKLGYAY
jgi:outer membrane receptor protein involved in Fe transport